MSVLFPIFFFPKTIYNSNSYANDASFKAKGDKKKEEKYESLESEKEIEREKKKEICDTPSFEWQKKKKKKKIMLLGKLYFETLTISGYRRKEREKEEERKYLK